MKTTLRRVEHLERARPVPASGATPSEVRQRILESLNNGRAPKCRSFETESPFEGTGTNPLSLREKILKRLRDENYVAVKESTR
jgi:hypothetical protein